MSARPQRLNVELPEGVDQYFDKRNLEVLECFGMNAPDLLNDYSCAVEDALIKVITDMKKLKRDHDKLTAQFAVMIDALKETSAASEVNRLTAEISKGTADDLL